MGLVAEIAQILQKAERPLTLPDLRRRLVERGGEPAADAALQATLDLLIARRKVKEAGRSGYYVYRHRRK